MNDKLQPVKSTSAAAQVKDALSSGAKNRFKSKLHCEHPTVGAFLDETGAIARDRFFAVGCLVLEEPAVLLRRIQKLRDTHHWYKEIHWEEVTYGTLPLYRELVKLTVDAGARYSCFVADRHTADPIDRYDKNPWRAYEKLAAQLLIGSIRPKELASVMADNYSTPDDVHFEEEVRGAVNARLNRLAVVTMCRMDSKACDALQAVDVLTGAVTFEFRQNAGLAGRKSPKAKLAKETREMFGVTSVLGGADSEQINLKVYEEKDAKKAKRRAA